MEDAHIATTDLGNAPDAAIFGVFDGHGGRCCSSLLLPLCQFATAATAEAAVKRAFRGADPALSLPYGSADTPLNPCAVR